MECTFAIDIVDNMRIEDNETFRLDIVSTDYPTHHPYTYITIVDDDCKFL